MKSKILISVVLLVFSLAGFSQNITIKILDNEREPVPNTHILIKETGKYICVIKGNL